MNDQEERELLDKLIEVMVNHKKWESTFFDILFKEREIELDYKYSLPPEPFDLPRKTKTDE